jgi:hypothetical protein
MEETRNVMPYWKNAREGVGFNLRIPTGELGFTLLYSRISNGRSMRGKTGCDSPFLPLAKETFA